MEANMRLLLGLLSSLVLCSSAEELSPAEGIPCSKYQVAFNRSCYEFVKLQRTFTSAQSWCERGGGHLVFIENEDTQNFLQEHISEDKEWWIGITYSSSSNETTEGKEGEMLLFCDRTTCVPVHFCTGSVIWLDTSNITYSNWHQEPPSVLESACGYILKNSAYKWSITENCSQEFDFICEFESGHSIACDGFNATVQCGSGEVIRIEDGFYGRKTPHYCVLETPLQFDVEEECTWTGVKDEVAGCNISCAFTGLRLAVTETSFIFENITISLKWLLSPYTGNLSCIISTGDGSTIDPYYPSSVSSNVTHSYTSPGEFTVFVECTTSEWHVTAQKQTTVLDRMEELLITGCFSKDEVGNSSHCRTLYGETLWIQVELNGGTEVTYAVLADNKTLMQSMVKAGILPHNLSLDATAQHLIGPGVHHLDIVASSNTTESEIRESLTVSFVEPISGLQATLASQTVELGEELEIVVSVPHGAPEKLRFELVGLNETFSHLEDEVQMKLFPHMSFAGTFQVKLFARNAFSNMSIDVGTVTVSSNNSSREVCNSFPAQVEAGSTLKDVSESLLIMNSEDDDDDQKRNNAARYLFSAVNNVFEATIQNGTGDPSAPETVQSLVSQQLLTTVDNLQSALLIGKLPDDEPTVLEAPSVAMYINRYCHHLLSRLLLLLLQTEDVDRASFSISNPSSASFTLPSTSSRSILGDSDETMDIRASMVSFSVNPFASRDSFDVHGAVGGLTLTSLDGSVIPISNLTEDIEIMLPRSSAVQVDSSMLNLGNVSALQVNVTTANTTLVIHLELDQDVPLMLYLGYGYPPNETDYDLSTRLPHDQKTREVVYSWILHPEDLIFGEGSYYFIVRSERELDPISANSMNVSVTCFVSQCVYWDEHQGNWNNYGCHVSKEKPKYDAIGVGPKTTPSGTQCLCNHLTFFGSSFFVMPNTIDVSKTVELFATFVDNPVVVTTVGCIFLLYLLVLIWARRKDIQDDAKVKITVLEDNDPFAQYRYLVTVFTGHRRGAATTSKVTLTLYGQEGESEPHHLMDPDTPVFERGAVDVFLLCTLFPLGELQSIRLWHDNSGDSPSWYVNRVLVHDVATNQKWYFLCNSWLAIDVGDCILDKVFPIATEQDMKQFSNLFFMKTSKGFQDSHIWYSIFSRSPRSAFTRAQRVSCCFSLLLCTMLTSIMFWGVPKDPADQKMDLGKIEFTWQEVMIGFESSLLMFPINLLIVQIFRNIRLRPNKETKEKKPGKSGRVSPSLPTPPQLAAQSVSLTPEAVIKDIRRIANSLFKALKTPLPPSETDFGKSTDINKLLALVEDIICRQNRLGQEFYDESKKKNDPIIISLGLVDLQEKTRTPTLEKGAGERLKHRDYNRCLYRQLQHVELELELLGPHRFQKPQSYSQAVRQVQHMKGLLESQLCSAASVSERGSPTPSLPEDDKKEPAAKGLPWWFIFIGWFLVALTSGVSGFFTMLYGLHYGKENSIKWLISMAISFFESLFITQPLKFSFVLAHKLKYCEDCHLLLLLAGDSNPLFGARRDSGSNIYQPPPATDIEKMKNNRIKEQKAFALIREILAYLGFLWMLLLVAYGQRDPNSYYLNKHIESSFTNGFQDIFSYQDFFKWANTTLISNLYGPYQGFITDGNSKLVGSARIRQVRVKRDTCPIAPKLTLTVGECHASYSFDAEDMSDYGEHWNISAADNSSELSSAWKYQSQSRLRGHPIWGKLDLYRGGGYVVHLGIDAHNASRILQYLFNNVWLDTFTRAVFVEFTVYNANVNLFCIVSLMFETNALGAFFTGAELQSVRLYPYTDGLHIFVVAAEVIYFLFVIYYMVGQGKLIRALKWNYFHSKWNLLELAIIAISWSALLVFVRRTILGFRDLTYYQEHKDEFASFNQTATVDAVLGYLIAFLVLLSTVKLWHLLRLNPKLNMITSTLRRAWGDISGFATVIIIMFLAYSAATNLIYGWKLNSYKTLFDSAETMVSLQLGIFNYEEVLDYNPVLGSFLIGSCIIFMTFVVLNLFISVILVAFSEEQKHYQASEEEEIVDLLLMKICSFFGIKCNNDHKPTCDQPQEEPVSN
ncbi:hypothetical protein lerEdw1_000988 [Lerista edwardsae]|nr:hypothetical protein lerEdw1_000988 [Lerista edwardsae]